MFKNQRGTIINLVVIIVGIIGILYTSTYLLIGMENRIHYSVTNGMKAYYISESGLERAKALLKSGIAESFTLEKPFSSQYNRFHKVEVTVQETQPDLYTITSTGTYVDTTRIMQAVIYKSEDDFVIQSWKEID